MAASSAGDDPMTLIDVHAHLIPPFYREALIAAGRGPSISGGFPAWSPGLALEAMDESGIGAAVLSISQPGVHFGDDGAARRLARHFNDYMARLAADHPGRLGAFAVLPLPDVAGACAEIDYALDVLKLDGIGILASYGEQFLGDDHFDPVLERLHAREAVVFVHPNLHPAARALKLGIPAWVVEYPFDTTRAAVNLVLSGKRRRFRKARMILAHAGGTIPFLAWRIAAAPEIDKRYAGLSGEDIRDDLRSFWYETAQAPGPEAFGALNRVAAPERILFGSDWPYCLSPVTAAMTRAFAAVEAPGPAWRQGVERENALRLFPRFAKAA
jgi:predicted TIM-barrel fold metal-dependent hydrolase